MVQMPQAMERIADVAHKSVMANFAVEGRPGWLPLAEETKRRRAQRGTWPKSPGILQDTDRLKESIRPWVSGNEAGAETDVFYGVYHQSFSPRKKIPARRFLMLTEKEVEEIVQIVIKELT
jgi:phage gpG-like protein